MMTGDDDEQDYGADDPEPICPDCQGTGEERTVTSTGAMIRIECRACHGSGRWGEQEGGGDGA